MPRLTSFSFEYKRSRYSLEFDLDDAAIMNDELSIDVTAKVIDRHGREFQEVLTILLDFENWKAKVLRGGKTIGELDLGYLSKVQEPWDDDGPDDLRQPPSDMVGDHVQDQVGDAIEEFIGLVPVPDPVFGCFIKAGISALVGQAVRCNGKVPPPFRRGQRVRAIARCLIDSSGGIFSRAAWRAARCFLTLGMG